MQLGAENVAIFKGFDSTALKPNTILYVLCCSPLNAALFFWSSSSCCSDRSALCGALQEVKHWNGEQDHSFTTTIG